MKAVSGVKLGGFAHQAAVEAAAEALVGADDNDATLRAVALLEQRMAEVFAGWRQARQHFVHQVGHKGVRPGRPCCALRILDAATICIALVIWAVFLTDLMRRRMSRVLGMAAIGKFA